MDTLTIKALQFHGRHGYYDSERREGNRFELDVILQGDFRQAGLNDDLGLTVNYETVEEIAGRIMHGDSLKLIETLCKSIGDALFEELPAIDCMELALRKLNPPLETPTLYTEIRMEWHRSS